MGNGRRRCGRETMLMHGSGSLPVQAKIRPSPHLTPKSVVRRLQPAILRAVLPCATAARTTPRLGVSRRCRSGGGIGPARLGRGSVEGTVPWT